MRRLVLVLGILGFVESIYAKDKVNPVDKSIGKVINSFNPTVNQGTNPDKGIACNPSPAITTSKSSNGFPKDSEWKKAGFGNPKIHSIDTNDYYTASKVKFTHQFPLTMVLFRNTGWNLDLLKQRAKRVAEIYSQCGIKLSSVNIVESDPFNGWLDVDGEENWRERWESRELKIARATPTPQRPVIYYFRNFLDDDIYCASSWYKGFKKGPPQDDTSWFSACDLDPKYAVPDKSFSLEAHELGHLLTNDGHRENGKKNFLARDKNFYNDHIDPDQCETMKKSPLVTTL